MGLGLSVFHWLTKPIASVRYGLKRPLKSFEKVHFIAHRGASLQAPENAMSAFQIALDSRADMIELDVHLSKDGEVIVIHDSNLRRTTNFDAEVADLTLGEIRHHFIINEKVEGNPLETVPTLDEVLQLVAGEKKVLIELKSPKNRLYPDFPAIVAERIMRNKAESWAIVQSFEQSYITDFTQNFAKIECHQLIEGVATFLPLYYDTRLRWRFFSPIAGVRSVNLDYKFLSRRFVKKMHRKGLMVYTYTANDRESIGRSAAFGVDGIITDNVSLVNKIRSSNR